MHRRVPNPRKSGLYDQDVIDNAMAHEMAKHQLRHHPGARIAALAKSNGTYNQGGVPNKFGPQSDHEPDLFASTSYYPPGVAYQPGPTYPSYAACPPSSAFQPPSGPSSGPVLGPDPTFPSDSVFPPNPAFPFNSTFAFDPKRPPSLSFPSATTHPVAPAEPPAYAPSEGKPGGWNHLGGRYRYSSANNHSYNNYDNGGDPYRGPGGYRDGNSYSSGHHR